MNKDAAPIITPIAAIMVMILIALLLLLVSKYLFAMYKAMFT